MSIDSNLLRQIIEAAIMAAGKPLTIANIQALFVSQEELELVDSSNKPTKSEIEAALEDIETDMADRGFELKEVSSGWRFQVKQDLAPWVGRLWEEKPQKYSRAMLETLALIAYRQPITRGEIEEIRGVAVSSHIIKTLSERNWVKVIGHKDVPGRPSMYATTKEFLDYFNLKSLEELPTLAELRDLDSLNNELDLGGTATTSSVDASEAESIESQISEAANTLAEPADKNSTDDENSLDENDEASLEGTFAEEVSEALVDAETSAEVSIGESLEASSEDSSEEAKLVQAADIFKS